MATRSPRAWAARALALAAIATVGLLAGSAACFDTPRPSCAFLCGDDQSCPGGYTCASDGWCKLEGLDDGFVCDGVAVDAPIADAPSDAAVDASEIDAAVDADVDAEIDATEIDAPIDAPVDATPPQLTIVTSSPLTFGSIPMTTSTTRTVTVRNAGGEATSPITVGLTGNPAYAHVMDATDTCSGVMLPPSVLCAFQIRLTPPAVGNYTGVASVTATMGGSASINLTGDAEAMLGASPSPTSFGAVMVNMTATRSLTISNNGTLASGTITVTPPVAPFSILSDNCHGMTLAPSTSCTMMLEYAPTAAGASAGSLSVAATPGGTRTVMLSGTGI